MARINRAAGLENPLQSVFPQPVVANRAPTTSDTNYPIGQEWVDKSASAVYFLTAVTAGSATWALASPGASDVDTLTGDTGGALSPTAGNINILGGDGITVAGAGSTLTINRDAEGGYPITQFVVGASGEAGYTTVQAGIDAANSAGGGVVYIQPGSYTEDLTLYDGVDLYGTPAVSQNDGSSVTIIGTHTPPTSGHIGFNSIYFQDTTAIISSAAAGSTHIVLLNCESAVQNGYFFDLVNWTGILEIWDHNPSAAGAPFAVQDGGINNTGGATLFMFAAGFGFGTSNTMNLSGTIVVGEADISCPVNFQTGSSIAIDVCQFAQPVTFSGNSTGALNTCRFSGGSSAAITMSSSAAITIGQTVIESTNNPSIAGAGAGTLTLGTCNFTGNSALAGTLTVAYDTTVTGGITSEGASTLNGGTVGIGTDNATNAITIGTGTSARTVSIANSAAAHTVNIGTTNTTATTTISAGTGGVQLVGEVDLTTGSLQIEGAGQRLAVEGGAATDFIGQATLVAGTVTVANTNITANDKVFVTREGVGASTALGVLNVSISASTSFTITALQPGTPGSTETNDVSVVNYFIVRQL